MLRPEATRRLLHAIDRGRTRVGAAGDAVEHKADRHAAGLPASAAATSRHGGVLAETHGAGRPLDDSTRQAMETRLGADLSAVRVHHDEAAAASADALGARAFTDGTHIAFGRSQYQPAQGAGQSLLAHELSHITQGDAASGVLRRSGPGDPPGGNPRGGGLTQAQRAKIGEARKFFNLPPTPTGGATTIVGVLIDPSGKEYPLKSGHEGGPFGGTQRGNVPRGRGEGFSGGAPSEKNIVTHIEGHAAAKMHELGLTEATLLSEEPPCKVCDASQGWDPLAGGWTEEAAKQPGTPAISSVLPPGGKLTIVDPGATTVYSSFRARPPAPPAPAPATRGAKPASGGVKPGPGSEPAQKATRTTFETRGEVKYEIGDPIEPPRVSDPYAAPAAKIGEGLAAILPSAMEAFQDKIIRNAVAHRMKDQWPAVERTRRDFPGHYIAFAVSLQEWEHPDPAGMVARMVNYVTFVHAETKEQCGTALTGVQAASAGPRLGRGRAVRRLHPALNVARRSICRGDEPFFRVVLHRDGLLREPRCSRGRTPAPLPRSGTSAKHGRPGGHQPVQPLVAAGGQPYRPAAPAPRGHPGHAAQTRRSRGERRASRVRRRQVRREATGAAATFLHSRRSGEREEQLFELAPVRLRLSGVVLVHHALLQTRRDELEPGAVQGT